MSISNSKAKSEYVSDSSVGEVDSSNSVGTSSFIGFDFSTFFSNGGLIFLFTVSMYYAVSLDEKLKFESLGIPSDYIDLPFYNIFESLERLLIVIVPLFVFSILIVYMLLQRLKINLVDSSVDIKKSDSNISNLYIDFVLFFSLSLLFFIFFIIGKHIMPPFSFLFTILKIFTFLLFFRSLYLLIFIIFWGKKKVYLNSETLFNRALTLYLIMVFLPHFFVVINFLYEGSQPEEIIISDKVKRVDGFIEFKYLVVNGNEDSMWLTLGVKEQKVSDDSLIYIATRETIETIKNTEIKTRKITVQKSLVPMFNESDNQNQPIDRMATWFHFKNQKDAETQLKLSFDGMIE